LDPNEWIQIDRNYRQQIQLKKRLLNSSHREDLFCYKDEAYAGAMETLNMLIDYLPNQYPNMFETNHSKTKITNLITNETFNLTESDHLHPLEIATRLVQEDLVIMQRNSTEETYHANVIHFSLLCKTRIFLFIGFSSLFSIWMVTQIEIWFTISSCSYATCSIFSREITHING
jgi:hypothetical protein